MGGKGAVMFSLPDPAAALLSGVLPLRYCFGRFACGVLTWSVPAHGQVRVLSQMLWSRHVGLAQQLGLVVGRRVLCGSKILGER